MAAKPRSDGRHRDYLPKVHYRLYILDFYCVISVFFADLMESPHYFSLA